MQRSLEIGLSLMNPHPGDYTTPWMRFFDQARLLSSTGHTAALLKDPNAVDYAIQAVESLDPAMVKSRAVVLAEAALTAAMAGELELSVPRVAGG